MNLNFKKNEYDLNGLQTEEVIRLYGICVKIIFTEKINKDLTFGDFSHFRTDNKSVFQVYVMPENTDDFEDQERLQTQFSLPLDGTVNFFISKITAYQFYQKSENSQNEFDVTQMNETIQRLHGALLVLPSGKIMEVTKVDLDAIGANNMFLSSIDKNAYCLRCRTYIHHSANEIDVNTDIVAQDNPDKVAPDMFDSLEKYFDEMVERNETQKANIEDRFERDSDDVFGRF